MPNCQCCYSFTWVWDLTSWSFWYCLKRTMSCKMTLWFTQYLEFGQQVYCNSLLLLLQLDQDWRAYTTIGDDRLEEYDPATEQNLLCCANEIWSIFTTIILQDGPFLALRLYVILKNETLTYTILFFTLKNILVLLVQIYRLFVVCCCSTGPTALQAGIRTSVQQQLLQQPVSLQRI